MNRRVVEGLKYDPECVKTETAIKAIYLLWRKGKVDLIEQSGLEWRMINRLFGPYDLFRESMGKKMKPNDLLDFIEEKGEKKVAKRIIDVSVHMVEMYKLLYEVKEGEEDVSR